MNFKGLFDGGVPGETYGQGIRRRLKSDLIVWAFILVSLVLTYSVYALSGSVWVTLAAATMCGIASSRLDLGIDPVIGDFPRQSEKRIWLVLFAPALMLVGGASIYVGLQGDNLVGAGLLAGLFGCILGFTFRMLAVTAKIGEDRRDTGAAERP